jgi:hypothetical protein
MKNFSGIVSSSHFKHYFCFFVFMVLVFWERCRFTYRKPAFPFMFSDIPERSINFMKDTYKLSDTYHKNVLKKSVLTLCPKKNKLIFQLSPFTAGGKKAGKSFNMLIRQSRINIFTEDENGT